MIPYDITGVSELAFYQGARWAHTLRFKDGLTGDPIDISGLTFSVEIKDPFSGVFLATISTGFFTDGTDGLLSVSLSAAKTKNLELGTVRFGMRDQNDDPYFEGIQHVLKFTPDPV